MHSGVWDGLIEELSGSFEIITLDLRGHGASREVPGPYTYDAFAGDIIDLLRELARARITALGWSMGVSVLLKAYARSPELFKRLVFISGNPSLMARPGYACGIPAITVQRLYRQVERAYPEGLKNFYSLLLTADEQELFSHDPRYAAMTAPAAAPAKDAALACLRCLMEEDLRPALAGVTAPTLIMHGGSDGICVPSAAAFMHEKIPCSRLVMLEQAGHMPFLTRRDDTCRELHAFLGNCA
jgi:pimeloyl-ACP methyl ester carboxylesterase